jgi:hypothetical protein
MKDLPPKQSIENIAQRIPLAGNRRSWNLLDEDNRNEILDRDKGYQALNRHYKELRRDYEEQKKHLNWYEMHYRKKEKEQALQEELNINPKCVY